MMTRLLGLLLLIPNFITGQEENWWETDLGIFTNLYDTILAEDLSQREARFYGEAENVKSLLCRSNKAFIEANRNMSQCLKNAEEKYIKPYEQIFYTNLNQAGADGLRFYGKNLIYIEPSMAATLVMGSLGALMNGCIPENNAKLNKTDSIFDMECANEYQMRTFETLWNADRYTRVKYLERRGLLVEKRKSNAISESNIINASSNSDDFNLIIQYLEKEFIQVYCRSGLGITVEDDNECKKIATNDFLNKIDVWALEDIKTFNYRYVSKDISKAFAIQYAILGIEKCLPYTLTLDKFFDRKIYSKTDGDAKVKESMDCFERSFGNYITSIRVAEDILKKEDEWKNQIERQRKQRLAEARLQREREAIKKEQQRQRDAERESIGGFFGRLVAAVIVETAEAYIQEKIAKELNIKTGVYKNQDRDFCYYSTPTGTKKIRKKGGKSKTINYANVGTNKPVFTYSNMPGGWSEKNTIYNFSESHVFKVQKTMHYSCPTKI